uniref:Hexosyltransferase n=1 Tax=Ditylenchus dipsaci TaxID=166011 RepID=A0A915CSK4_9BILA
MRLGCFRSCHCCYISRHYRSRWWLVFAGIFLLLLVVVWEESSIGSIRTWYGNHYSRLIYLPITGNRASASRLVSENVTVTSEQLNIGVVVILKHSKDVEEYSLAQRTLHCYCQFHQYILMVIDLQASTLNSYPDPEVSSWRRICNQTDFMFRRHCVLAQLLRSNQTTNLDYVLFVDGDVGVINPTIYWKTTFRNRQHQLICYIARRSNYTIQFLETWANYFFQLPPSFHGSDNGAIHAVLLDQLCPHVPQPEKGFVMSCGPALWITQDYGRIVVLNNSTGYWARDGWLTGNQWSAEDFMLHGWQRRRLDKVIFAGWHSPLGDLPTPTINCGQEGLTRAYLQWPYKDSFIKPKEYIQDSLFQAASNSYAQHLHNLRLIDHEYI